jgi:hypothetical protein
MKTIILMVMLSNFCGRNDPADMEGCIVELQACMNNGFAVEMCMDEYHE